MTRRVTRIDGLAALSPDHLGQLAVLPVELVWNPRIRVSPIDGFRGVPGNTSSKCDVGYPK